MQVCKVSKYTSNVSIQVYSMQVYMYSSLHLCKYVGFCQYAKYEDKYKIRYAGMQVLSFCGRSGLGGVVFLMPFLNFSCLTALQIQDLSRICSAWKGLAILSCEKGVPQQWSSVEKNWVVEFVLVQLNFLWLDMNNFCHSVILSTFIVVQQLLYLTRCTVTVAENSYHVEFQLLSWSTYFIPFKLTKCDVVNPTTHWWQLN